MNKILLHYFQRMLTVIGSLMSLNTLWKLQMVVNYLKLGRYYVQNGFLVKRRLGNREAVFDSVIKDIYNARVLYLEFGVYKGESIKYWANSLKHPESIFLGFDSFEGLPEDFDFNGPVRKGEFSTGGKIPEINDSRIKFVKGWFDQVLPTYSPLPKLDKLVIVMDADLYISTIYVLRSLIKYIIPGTYLYFDDMSRIEHDPRAFQEFMEESGLRFEFVSADLRLNKVFFICV